MHDFDDYTKTPFYVPFMDPVQVALEEMLYTQGEPWSALFTVEPKAAPASLNILATAVLQRTMYKKVVDTFSSLAYPVLRKYCINAISCQIPGELHGLSK